MVDVTSTSTTEAKAVPETSVFNSTLTGLIDREDFIATVTLISELLISFLQSADPLS
jgi:hypothetical protein